MIKEEIRRTKIGGNFMNDSRTLLIGIDINDEYTQISNYQYAINAPEAVTFSSEKDAFLIPTCLCVKESTKEWLFGHEAIRCNSLMQGEIITDLMKKLEFDEVTTIYGVEFTAIDLLTRYFKKLLGAIKQVNHNQGILKLAITTKKVTLKIKMELLKVFDRLGLEKERVLILSHIGSFMYYAMSQKPELWVNDVGLFHYDEDGLSYHQLSIGRRMSPVAVVAKEHKILDEFAFSLRKQEEPARLAYRFEELAKQVLFKKIVSTLYITGRGFEGGWADPALRNLCVGRRVFQGQNLYTKGACYAAYVKQDEVFKDFIFLNEDMISSNISLRLYHNAKEEDYVLASATTPWWEIDTSIYVILDDIDELTFSVTNMLTKESIKEIMKLNNMQVRENKTIRLQIRLHFINRETAVITAKDTGFGEFYESCFRIWEQVLIV